MGPHLAGTRPGNTAISPMYNQGVESNPLNPDEVIGDLSTRCEVSLDGLLRPMTKAMAVLDGYAV
jgi:hypothetical protein